MKPTEVPPPLLVSVSRSRRIAAIASSVLLLSYAGFCRWIFATPWMEESGGVVSLSFIASVPFALGALSVCVGRWRGSDNWIHYAVWCPSILLTVGLVICLVTQIEAAICVIMAAPILYGGALLGAGIAHALLPTNISECRLQLSFAVFLPFIAAYVESSFRWPTEVVAIKNTITINAPAEQIWPEIASVPAIPPNMIPDRWIYRVGFPKPIAATLDHEGVGGVRTATFERGVSFFEKVTVWEPGRKLAFTIRADPDFIPHTAFDQHIIVGGRFYDVLDGIYEIEPVSPTTTRLHLTSHHR